MDLQVRSNGTKVTEDMRAFIDRRMAKLDRLADRVVDAQLELRTEQPRTGGPQTTAQLTLQTGHHILRAEERDEEPAKAIDAAIDKLIRQVRKHNDKRRGRRRRAGQHPMTEYAAAVDLPDLDHAEDAASIDAPTDDVPVRVKRFGIKPMHVDEAIDQMELLGHDFYLFHNADEDRINVVYRRRDASYGLLSPDGN